MKAKIQKSLSSIKVISANKEIKTDYVIIEEPLEIKLIHRQRKIDLAVTMRTPGDDFNLVSGFLFTEGIIHSKKDILKISYTANQNEIESQENSISVHLATHVPFDLTNINRHFYASSSCGVCGKSSIEMIRQNGQYILTKHSPSLKSDVIKNLYHSLNTQQSLFKQSGGNHAAAVFSNEGQISSYAEDVGRHNAVDKVIGHALGQGKLPLKDKGLIVSGRAGFELIQKAYMAGISFFVAIGAPSSLAIKLAEDVGMTLIGFLKADSFNVYSHNYRVT